jgi:hypothetical protein
MISSLSGGKSNKYVKIPTWKLSPGNSMSNPMKYKDRNPLISASHPPKLSTNPTAHSQNLKPIEEV